MCYSNYEEIKSIPVFCYVHPSLAINQGNTIILCHIGYILEKLANYKRFPEFNTQAVISFLNATNKSKLYENMNSKLPKFQKIDLESINFVPIWYVNGSRCSRADYTELFTTFEILIHILSKRFISFKSQLLSISL